MALHRKSVFFFDITFLYFPQIYVYTPSKLNDSDLSLTVGMSVEYLLEL